MSEVKFPLMLKRRSPWATVKDAIVTNLSCAKCEEKIPTTHNVTVAPNVGPEGMAEKDGHQGRTTQVMGALDRMLRGLATIRREEAEANRQFLGMFQVEMGRQGEVLDRLVAQRTVGSHNSQAPAGRRRGQGGRRVPPRSAVVVAKEAGELRPPVTKETEHVSQRRGADKEVYWH
ncbi:uncharacterized protein AB9W97_019146 [Spinachia spinachia]